MIKIESLVNVNLNTKSNLEIKIILQMEMLSTSII